MQIFSAILLQIAAEAEEERVGDTVRGCSSVWVDAATGDSASLLYKNRADRGPGNGALCACMSFSIESFFFKSFWLQKQPNKS